MTKGVPCAGSYRTLAVVNHCFRPVIGHHSAGRLCAVRQSLFAVQNDSSPHLFGTSDHDAAAKGQPGGDRSMYDHGRPVRTHT